MDLSPENFVSPEIILADVLKTVKDSGYKLNSKGWYLSQMQQALEELSFDTFFITKHEAFDMPENLRLDMPKGSFNLRNVYLFNGTKCTIKNRVNVYRKKNFINGTSGQGYVARDHWDNNNDPFHKHRAGTSKNNLFYFSIQNGMLMLSSNCASYEKVMLEFNGIISDIGDAPIIPQFFRQAVKGWVTVKALEEKCSDKIGTNEYGHWANLLNKYDSELNKPYDGHWAKAEHRSKQLNEKDRNDFKEYFTRLNY